MNKQNLKSKLLPLILCAVVILLDQITKAIVVNKLPQITSDPDVVVPVFGNFLRFIHARNLGVAFSMGAGFSHGLKVVLFKTLPLLVIIAVMVIYFRNNDLTKLQRWCVMGIVGGGIGNIIDRIFRPEGVVDFIDVAWFNMKNSKLSLLRMQRWPTFNVADCAVVICGALFVLTFVVQVIKDKRAKKQESENE